MCLEKPLRRKITVKVKTNVKVNVKVILKRLGSTHRIKTLTQNQKPRNLKDFRAFLTGADDQSRTGDLILTKDALYLLSYISMLRLRGTFDIIRL